jgi:hypothetical protein
MKNLQISLFLILSSAFISCGSNPANETATEDEAIVSKDVTAICMWNKLALRETPSAEGKYITAGNMGELMIYLDSTVTDESSDKKREYAFVKLSDGTNGWIRNDLIVIDAELAVIINKAAICQRADLITKTDKSFEPMDIIAIKKSENGWANVKGIIKGGTWYTEGWIQESALSYRSPDITDAILTTKALTIKDKGEQKTELKRVYNLEYADGLSEFKPDIKSLIGLDDKVYDYYKCWFAEAHKSPYSNTTIDVLGNSYNSYNFSIIGFVEDFAFCMYNEGGNEKEYAEILETLAEGIAPFIETNGGSFKYVNPTFVNWASDNLIPTPEDDFLGVSLQLVYNGIIREQIRTLATTSLDFDYWAYRFVERYEIEVIENENSALSFLDESFSDQDIESRWLLGFWIRRSIDGSRESLRNGLDSFLKNYDNNWYESKISDYEAEFSEGD